MKRRGSITPSGELGVGLLVLTGQPLCNIDQTTREADIIREKEDAIMGWILLSIGTLTALLVVISLHLIWKPKSLTFPRKR
jgi:hypothetical protein